MKPSLHSQRADEFGNDARSEYWVVAGSHIPAKAALKLPFGAVVSAGCRFMNESACLALGGIRKLPGSDSQDYAIFERPSGQDAEPANAIPAVYVRTNFWQGRS